MSDSAFNGSKWKNQFKQGIGLRILILKVLNANYNLKNPLTAYEIQSAISEMTFSFWKPSPGSIYPILSELSGKRFVIVDKRENKDYYSLTREGEETFNQILSFKLMADLFMSARLYENFDLNSIQIPLYM
ncbi:MAG: PadR family transcriptional regulator, partial [Candidatus Hodarchaeales archaeon]